MHSSTRWPLHPWKASSIPARSPHMPHIAVRWWWGPPFGVMGDEMHVGERVPRDDIQVLRVRGATFAARKSPGTAKASFSICPSGSAVRVMSETLLERAVLRPAGAGISAAGGRPAPRDHVGRIAPSAQNGGRRTLILGGHVPFPRQAGKEAFAGLLLPCVGDEPAGQRLVRQAF